MVGACGAGARPAPGASSVAVGSAFRSRVSGRMKAEGSRAVAQHHSGGSGGILEGEQGLGEPVPAAQGEGHVHGQSTPDCMWARCVGGPLPGGSKIPLRQVSEQTWREKERERASFLDPQREALYLDWPCSSACGSLTDLEGSVCACADLSCQTGHLEGQRFHSLLFSPHYTQDRQWTWVGRRKGTTEMHFVSCWEEILGK